MSAEEQIKSSRQPPNTAALYFIKLPLYRVARLATGEPGNCKKATEKETTNYFLEARKTI